jgi:PAS domain S-box-containing protein
MNLSDTNTLIGIAIGAGTIVTAVGGAAWRVYIKRVRPTWQMIRGLVDITKKTAESTELLLKYVGPNGGKSLWDGQKRIEERQMLLDARSGMQLIYDEVAEWRTDEAGRTIRTNGIQASVCGRQEADFLGFSWLAVVHEDDRHAVRAEWVQAVSDKRIFEMKYRLVGSCGTIYPVHVRAWPMTDNAGAMTGYLGRTVFMET